MKNDYLWDGSGADAEIERLESVLSVLKYQPAEVPAVAEKFAVAPKRPWQWVFSLRVAFASATVALIAVAIWSLASPVVKRDSLPRTEIAGLQTAPHVTSDDTQKAAADPEPATSAESKTIVKIRWLNALSKPDHTVRPKRRSGPAAERTDGSTAATVHLTKEEKYAYGKLMLALSITGSKLKLVQDSIDGVDDTDRVENQVPR